MPYLKNRSNNGLYFKDWGTGRPVVLIHGWPLCSDAFDVQSMHLAEQGFRVIAYDRRGFGRSDQPFDGYDYDTMADDLCDVIDTLDLRDAVIAGFSMGGGEVVRYLSRHGGERIAGAVLISSVVPLLELRDDHPDGVDPSLFDSMKEGIEKDRPGFFAEFFKAFYGVGLLKHPVSDATLDWSRQMAMRASLKATMDCVDAFGRTDFRRDLENIDCPMMVIHGTADATVPIELTADKVAQALPRATIKRYEGSPHGLPATDAKRLSDDLIEFARGLN